MFLRPADAEQRGERDGEDAERGGEGDRCGGERDRESELGVGVAGDDVDDPAEEREAEPEPDVVFRGCRSACSR